MTDEEKCRTIRYRKIDGKEYMHPKIKSADRVDIT